MQTPDGELSVSIFNDGIVNVSHRGVIYTFDRIDKWDAMGNPTPLYFFEIRKIGEAQPDIDIFEEYGAALSILPPKITERFVSGLPQKADEARVAHQDKMGFRKFKSTHRHLRTKF